MESLFSEIGFLHFLATSPKGVFVERCGIHAFVFRDGPSCMQLILFCGLLCFVGIFLDLFVLQLLGYLLATLVVWRVLVRDWRGIGRFVWRSVVLGWDAMPILLVRLFGMLVDKVRNRIFDRTAADQTRFRSSSMCRSWFHHVCVSSEPPLGSLVYHTVV